jgi:hypothetical protein
LRRWWWGQTLVLKEKTMSKNETPKPRVVWQLSNDGLQPSQTPYGFIGRNPLSRVIPPGEKLLISLQVQANVPLLAFAARSHADDVTCPQVFQPGQDIVCVVENKSKHAPLTVEDKESLISLFPLMFDGTGELG